MSLFRLMKKPSSVDPSRSKDRTATTTPLKPATPTTVASSHDTLTSSTSSLTLSSATTTTSTTGESGRALTGLLTVRIVEARVYAGLRGGGGGSSGGYYAVVEFDKNEVVAAARDGDGGGGAAAGTVRWYHKASFDVSRESDVVVSVYQRASGRGGGGGGSGSSGDVLVGNDARIQDTWRDLTPSNYASGNGSVAATGQIRLQLSYQQNAKKHLTVDDFDLLKVIGKGSFGKVMQVRKKDTSRIYAMKIIKKTYVVEREEVAHTLAERRVLAEVAHPFVVPIKFSFQTREKLYLVLAFVNGGELFYHLKEEGSDLKPENILLDHSGHIALCDFGLCKLDMTSNDAKTSTFCGTPEYLAPELLSGQAYTKAVDWWTLGILLYEMLTGLPPFYDEDVREMYAKILGAPLEFNEGDVGEAARDLLRKMLDRDPTRRLGAQGADEIKRHRFFEDINWTRLMQRKYNPTFRPNVASATDTSNFDAEFTSEPARDSYVDGSRLTDADQRLFDGFSYRPDGLPEGAAAGSVVTRGGEMVVGSLVGANARLGGGSERGASSYVGSFTKAAAGPSARRV
ncbi:kinase-like domain-containing protein [Zopfochytrium polystomum]|nr:kinase-like domain-containing protein [Zopfochytrium polystomum]